MNQQEFEIFEGTTLLTIADKAKDIEIALRIHKDWTDRNQSRLAVTKIRDKANEILALYVDIIQAEMQVEDEEPERTEQITFDPYEDEGNTENDFGFNEDNISDYLGNI